ncbi:hypothetical protein [Shewanella woodyi]|uniref:Uncharacterized protein n=1 Tax=Shewanella woodyi (strain ATCC 51908 / MS32) TaxID=392500 RepID=B1KKC4_SHEWM|nr:hypothetical protein [Shewanella woodyi]ACA85764.1 hypothetical protein Swoo_1476 [Shewanella woodyi ATCC 51908]
MKIVKYLLFLAFLLSSSAFARTDCPAAKVLHIQIEGSVILYMQEGSSWRRLGNLDEVGTAERYSALLAAQIAGLKVMVGYRSSSYNCAVTNYSEPAYIVRTYNRE